MYDAIVIGSGPAGYVAALRLIHHGLKVALIERKYLGGECTNWGCIPSKALIDIAHSYGLVKLLRKVGFNIEVLGIDRSKVMYWIRRAILRSREAVKMLLSEADIYEGFAKIKTPRKVLVEGKEGLQEIEGRNIIIATGTDPACIPNLKFNGKYVISNREFFELNELPSSVLIVGGGVVGSELGLALAKLGVKVYIVEILDRILNMYDPDVSEVITKSLRHVGVRVYTSSTLKSVEVKEGKILARIVGPKGEGFNVLVEKVLIAAGRKYNTQGIGLEDIGVKVHSKGFIEVDNAHETNVKGVYAIGDVTGPPLLAHKAFRDGVRVADIIAGRKDIPPKTYVPEVVYTEPEIGVIGLTELRAKEKGINYKVIKYPYTAISRDYTSLSRTPEGFVKLLISRQDNRLIGATIVGNGASEIIHVVALALHKKLNLKDLSELIYAHPTYSEGIGEAAHLGMGEPIHYRKA